MINHYQGFRVLSTFLVKTQATSAAGVEGKHHGGVLRNIGRCNQQLLTGEELQDPRHDERVVTKRNYGGVPQCL